MHRFFADENGIVNGMAYLNPGDSQHALRVLRLGSGDEVELVCAPGRYLAQIAGETDGEAALGSLIADGAALYAACRRCAARSPHSCARISQISSSTESLLSKW